MVTLDEVKEMGDAGDPLNIFNINRKKLLTSLRSDYRVEKADLALGWPNILRVVITDRQPALYVAMGRDPGMPSWILPATLSAWQTESPGATLPLCPAGTLPRGTWGDVTEDEEIQGDPELPPETGSGAEGTDHGNPCGRKQEPEDLPAQRDPGDSWAPMKMPRAS